MTPRPALALVNTETGESVPFVDQEVAGLQAEIQMLRDQLKGADADVNRWRHKYQDLKRDKEAEAREDALWPNAVRLFRLYCRLTGKPDKKTGEWKPRKLTWNWERFEEVRPHLQKHGLAMCERAIVGRVFHHHSDQRPNGSTIHYYEWGRIFGNLGKGSAIENFEESCNRAPLDFVSELEAQDEANAGD
jgi:hypothetical protein